MEVIMYDSLPQGSIDIRNEVFVKEQGFDNEFDDLDQKSIFVVVYENQKAIGTGRCYKKDNGYVIGRVAVLKEFRNQGIGRKVITALEDVIRSKNGCCIELSAQERVQEFYKCLGYTRVGDVYFDEHCAHVKMVKEL